MSDPLNGAYTRGPVRVRTLAEFAELNGMSVATLRRLIRSGNGPRVVELSLRRRGVRDDDGAEWQERRSRSSTSDEAAPREGEAA